MKSATGLAIHIHSAFFFVAKCSLTKTLFTISPDCFLRLTRWSFFAVKPVNKLTKRKTKLPLFPPISVIPAYLHSNLLYEVKYTQ